MLAVQHHWLGELCHFKCRNVCEVHERPKSLLKHTFDYVFSHLIKSDQCLKAMASFVILALLIDLVPL